jgi:hypothetical protein
MTKIKYNDVVSIDIFSLERDNELPESNSMIIGINTSRYVNIRVSNLKSGPKLAQIDVVFGIFGTILNKK